ncbi:MULTISPECIES: NUDIX hydrolase [Streptomyces]|uniref:NUDIX hydrolase n=1 Tax=Streptomyces TaxID=1883 RepID=UPI0006B28A9C|nr:MULTISPECIES: NUDIX hydrolase [Streptomyces]
MASPATPLPPPRIVCSALITDRASDGARTFLLVRTPDMPSGRYRLPVGQPTHNGIADHFDLHDAVLSGTGLRITVGRLLATDQITGATGRVHHHIRLCSVNGEGQKVRLGGKLSSYLWATEDDLALCGPELAPVVQAALRARSKGTRACFANGRFGPVLEGV